MRRSSADGDTYEKRISTVPATFWRTGGALRHCAVAMVLASDTAELEAIPLK